MTKEIFLPEVKEKHMITRLEIIDYTKPLEGGGGRTVIVSPTEGKKITYQIQDDERTLKIFIGRNADG